MLIIPHARGLLLGALCLGAGLSLSPRALAGFNVVETTDWSGNLGSPFLVPEPLGVGVNTLVGTLPLPSNGQFGDVDVFQIDNPAGLMLGGFVNLEISDFVAGGGLGLARLELLLPSSGSVNFSGDGSFAFVPNVVDLSSLRFRISAPSNTDAAPGSASYTVTITAIPEPSTLGLLLVGALAAGAVLRGGKREPRRPGLGA